LKKKRKIDPQSVISFVAKIRHFAFFYYYKKVPSNMVKGTFLENFQNNHRISFHGRKF